MLLHRTILLASLLVGHTAFAALSGGESSGGGGGFVCRDSQGMPGEVELLDTWEARNLMGWQIPTLGRTQDQILEDSVKALEKLSPTLSSALQYEISVVKSKLTFIPSGVRIAPPADASPIYVKINCPLEGIMYFDGLRGKLMADKTLFDRLTESDRAGMFLHEAIYKMARRFYGDTVSARSRMAVGCLMSPDCKSAPMFETAIPTVGPLAKCVHANYEYYYFPLKRRMTRFVFTKIDGLPTQSFVDADNVDYHEKDTGPYRVGGFKPGVEIRSSELEQTALTMYKLIWYVIDAPQPLAPNLNPTNQIYLEVQTFFDTLVTDAYGTDMTLPVCNDIRSFTGDHL